MRYFFPGERPFESLPKFGERYTHLWIGIVRRYDQDNETCDVEFINLPGGRTAVPFSLAFAGRRAFLGGPPEEGSVVFIDWIPQTSMGLMSPVIVGYAHSGFEPQRRFDLTRELIDPDDFPGRRIKTPKLYPGDMALVSAAGSHVLADENLSLASASLTEILLRSSDLSVIYNALQHYMEGAGARMRMGMVERSSGTEDTSRPLQEDDRYADYVTKGQNATPVEADGTPWSELRWEVRESTTGQLAVPETLFGNKLVNRNWLIQQVMGTLVGDNPADAVRYAKVLIRKVLDGTSISRDYLVAGSSAEEESAASVWHIVVPNGSSDASSFGKSIDFDRSGRLAISLGKTASSHPVGEGKSLQIAADGSFNGVFGSESGGSAVNLQVNGDSTTNVEGNTLHSSSGTSTLTGSVVFLGSGGGLGSRPF